MKNFPFMLFAVPLAPITGITVTVPAQALPTGFYTASVTVYSGSQVVGGVPYQVTITWAATSEAVTVYGGSPTASAGNSTILLPLSTSDAPGMYNVTVVDLLAGTSNAVSVTVVSDGAGGEAHAGVGSAASADSVGTRAPRTVTMLQSGSTNVTLYHVASVRAFLSAARASQVPRAKVALTPAQAADTTQGAPVTLS
jgi:hypothetical protein